MSAGRGEGGRRRAGPPRPFGGGGRCLCGPLPSPRGVAGSPLASLLPLSPLGRRAAGADGGVGGGGRAREGAGGGCRAWRGVCVCGGRLPKAEPGAGLPEGGRGKGLRASRGARELGRRPAPLLGAEDGACGGGGGCRYPELLCGKKEQKRPTRSFKHSFSGWYRFHERQLVICMGSYSPGARGLVTVAVATPPLPRSRST